MAKTAKQHKVVGEDYLRTAKQPGAAHRFPYPPQMVWNALLDAKAWSEWLKAIERVEWTSPQPWGVGTTRTVHVSGGNRIEEVFFAWDQCERMAFYFDRTTLPISAGIEDYTVRKAPGGSELVWTGKASAPLILGWVITKGLTKGIASGLPDLEKLIASDPERFGG
ncbi:MAG: SRPBCC family protein [Pacificimonas sp.]|nr:SRPBCC family protein [Pacificimonas sp.]